MANFNSNTVTYSDVAGSFKERDTGNNFEYMRAEANEFNAPHVVACGGIDNREVRFATVKKTVAYVIVDVDDAGNAVIEKWNLRHLWAREERGAIANIGI